MEALFLKKILGSKLKFPEVFLNLRKSQSEPLLNTMDLRISIKYYRLKTSIKCLRFKNLRKIPWV